MDLQFGVQDRKVECIELAEESEVPMPKQYSPPGTRRGFITSWFIR